MKKSIRKLASACMQDKKLTGVLEGLHPGENAAEIYDRYQKKKVSLMMALMVTGFVSALGVHLCSRMETGLAEGAQLIRNEWGAGDYQVTLLAKIQEWSREIPFVVEERTFTKEELGELKEQLQKELQELIKGRNEDISHVREDLELVTAVQGYPFTLTWKSSNENRIRSDGKVNKEEVPSCGEWVLLQVTVNDGLQGKKDVFEYEVCVLPEVLSEEEAIFRQLSEKLLEESTKNIQEPQIVLPKEVNGTAVSWERKEEDNSIFLLFLFLLGSVLAGKGMDYDLEKSLKKRNRQLSEEYAVFVNKLRLYLAAGLTLRNAFVRITAEYGRLKKKGEKNYLYEELKIGCFQLENGVPEEQVYLDFGRRCRQMRYRHLSFLLGVQLKQGNEQLLKVLEREADSAMEEHRNLAKKAGEEAGTKLLFPMILMLVVVMLLVLLPAYLDFSTI